jgi:hypothetical protein
MESGRGRLIEPEVTTVLTFKIVKEDFGWAVRIGDGMTTPFWSRAAAVREAHELCERMRRHGVAAEVVSEDGVPSRPVSAATDRSRPGETHGWS